MKWLVRKGECGCFRGFGWMVGWMGGCGYFWGEVTVTDYHYAFIVAAQCHCVGQDARIRRNPS